VQFIVLMLTVTRLEALLMCHRPHFAFWAKIISHLQLSAWSQHWTDNGRM